MDERLSMLGLICSVAGAVAAVVAAAASVMTVGRMAEQNSSIREQNEKITQQIKLQSDQNYQQRSDAVAARRLQALNSLYESVEPSGTGITPRADQRARAEAIKYFVELEQTRPDGTTCKDAAMTTKDCIVLTSALLQRTDLRDMTLTRVVLADAKFQSAELLRAKLDGSYLRGADFTGSFLNFTDMSYADLQGANLTKATLFNTDFRCADLSGANLQDVVFKPDGQRMQIQNAYLRGVKNPPPGFIEFARGANAFVDDEIDEWRKTCRK